MRDLAKTPLVRLLLLTAALAVLALAQLAIDHNADVLDWPGKAWLDSRFEMAFLSRNALAAVLPLLVAGATVFALAASSAEDDGPWRPLALARPDRLTAAALAVGLASCIAVIGALFAGRYHWSFTAYFFGGLLTVLLLVLLGDAKARPFTLRRPTAAFVVEMLIVGALVGTFVGINVRDLDSWQYAVIGDEGPFYETAKQVLEDRSLNWFSQVDGPYHVHPVLSSVWHAGNLAVFGDGLFGWKMGALSAIAITIPVFFLLLREMFGTRPALFGAMFLAASHYLFAYAHTGYDNIFPLFPTVASFYCAVAGLRRGRPSLLVASGVAAGLGFYTFYSSRVIIIMLGLAFATLPDRRRAMMSVGLVGAGFALAVLPLFATDGWTVVSEGGRQSIFQNEDVPLLEHLGYNVVRSVFPFYFNPEAAHYTAGALLDGISAVLATAGFALSIRRGRLFSYRLVLIWFVVAIAATGVLSLYTTVSISRLHYALPPLAAFAGVAVDEVLSTLTATSKMRLPAFAATGLGLTLLAPTIFVINGRQFFEYSATHHVTVPETVIMRALTGNDCRDSTLRPVVHMPDAGPALDGTHKFFGLERKKPLELSLLEPDAVFGDVGLGGGTGCVIAGPVLQAREIVAGLGDAAVTVTDRTGASEMAVLPAPVAARTLSPEELAVEWPAGAGLDGVFRALRRDALPALDGPPAMGVQDEPHDWFEPVLAVTVGEQHRAYPLRDLAWHGVVNDVLGGEEIAVTYDPFSGVARVYARRTQGRVRTFAYSGLMRSGGALLYDRETESLWQQSSGVSIGGPLAGEGLRVIPSSVTAYREFATSWPGGEILTVSSTDTRYDRNPLLAWDVPDGQPLFLSGPLDTRLPAMRRVLVVELDGSAVAVPFPPEAAEGTGWAAIVTVGSRPLLLFFNPMMRSSLDSRYLNESKLAGSMVVFEAGTLGGSTFKVLSSDALAWQAIDERTGIAYDFLGNVLAGAEPGLVPVQHYVGFWFSVAATHPGVEVLAPGTGGG